MREILFRAKTTLGKWVYGSLVVSSNGDSYIVGINDNPIIVDTRFWVINSASYKIIPETVGQFTGLTDKNGVKIFEGDILLFDDDQKSEVEWIQGGLAIEADFGDYDLTTVGWAIDILGGCEVIGNIHDNPELLNI